MTKFRRPLAAALLLAAQPAIAAAVPAAAMESAAFDGRLRASLVERASELIEARYVDPEVGAAAIERLERELADGAYAGLRGEELASAMTEDLQDTASDKHLYVRYEPKAFAALQAEGDAQEAEEAANAFWEEWARTSNHGLTEMKVLPGNVRYLKIDPFLWTEHGARPSSVAYDQAMSFLSGGDAIIIDLSENGGGSPDAVNYLVSHFVPEGTELMTFDMGPEGVSRSVSTAVPGPSLAGKPFFLLTGKGTGSAAEEAAMHVKHFDLGTLIGETTAGAGNRNEMFALVEGFTISISTGRAIHAVTGGGWEGTGVEPDISVSRNEALPTARRAALRELKRLRPDDAADYDKALSKLAE